jgi:hypothetical protein
VLIATRSPKAATPSDSAYWIYLEWFGDKTIMDSNGEYHRMHFVGWRVHKNGPHDWTNQYQTVNGNWITLE